MKTIKNILFLLLAIMAVTSCSKDDTEIIEETVDPMATYNLIKALDYTDHVIEIYSEKEALTVGYNPMFIRIKDKIAGSYISNPNLSWKPMMHMETMMHSAPASEISGSAYPTVFSGYIIFQMPGNATEYWDITLNYTVAGVDMTKTVRIDVVMPSDGLKKSQVFMGSDDVRYILAYVDPKMPQVTVNDFTAVLYKMEDMLTFSVVENYKIAVDPRMPGMGNHSSPNNQDLTYMDADKMYHGKLSLTMTGYWRINLKLMNEAGDVLKGEDVTDTNTESSLYFELEL
ncbi:hypothetical protein [Altibacter sp.]|uniref:hypothetical protein n=1 Tax=Altibacter sp. TaxID=2024823 RepID=UPI000C94E147|nr:hypothetical protein [Altibacter sp.]MAP55492.1 hypothetical protein [Altibacter sp.]